MKTVLFGLLASMLVAGRARVQVVSATGSYDNFDCFDDTGREAEGFEIEVEDVQPSDVTRIFPDNFPDGQPYIRYATPDRHALAPVTFSDGHRGGIVPPAWTLRDGALRDGALRSVGSPCPTMPPVHRDGTAGSAVAGRGGRARASERSRPARSPSTSPSS